MAQKVSTTINFEVTQITEGQYVVRQLEDEKPVHGYVDPDDKEIAVWPSVLGVQIGDGYKAGFSSGIQIQIVLAVYNGSVRFYVENRVLKMNLHLKPVIHWGDDVNFNGDIISF
ncbi:uncharacterized protein RCO7_11107 [Rhynchosporium graminicola]|uniref:Uncharacterized protein n=1 Tax=Rhynchosporium graminicola TaxID=2792576 RepID=A0A1E1L046_9HELO|nr:uncharacterized protein RCO7_11107 [Rhynchosporium commune]